MVCPRCRKDLSRETREGEEILVCRSCDGMWLHRHQLNNLLKESGGDVELCSYSTHPVKEGGRAIKCRDCKTVDMEKINFLEYSNIVIDRCPSCGSFWLDKKELENMHVYIRKVEEGSHRVDDFSAYTLLMKLSKIAYSIFH
ncbi:MAG: zf-TFIIB domain-containing protein [Spirochaetes bacterium]|nr:zf-TFIIB domain-containing protein [Spirochaetota bacterium]